MTQDKFDDLLSDAARTFRVPPEPDLDAMWTAIERDAVSGATRHAGRRRWLVSPSWGVFATGIAAALVAGVGLGRFSARPAMDVAPAVSVEPVARPENASFDRAATELLGRTAVLLSSLPTGVVSEASSMRFTAQAYELLTTTRLLLDSPAASDGRFKDLLEDLELVLAQIANLRSGRGREEMELITDALEERDVVLRIRSAVARMSFGAD